MFARLGGFTARYRWPIIAVWVAAATLFTIFAPDIDDVSVHDQRQFLPANTESLEASIVARDSFPGLYFASSAVIVVDAGQGRQATDGAAWKYVEELTVALTGEDTPTSITRVLSPATADESTAKALVSPDGQLAIISVSFDTASTEPVTRTALAFIADRLREAPEGVAAYATGDGPIISAYDKAARQSVDSTTWLTILLVVLILLLVYRSPVSPLIPLATIGLAYLVSRGFIAILGNSVITISGYTNIFIVVVLFGAGTDYCLFLISRFREETTGDVPVPSAVRKTVRVVGETITSSAGTVVVGLSTMAFAELGFYNTSGPSVAIAVVIALVAGLTLTPALLAVLGRRSFWPRKSRAPEEGNRLWGRWAHWVTSHPKSVLAASVIVLVPLAWYGQGQMRDFDLVGDLAKDNPTRRGFDVLSDHLDPGTIAPLTFLARDPQGLDDAEGLARVVDLQNHLAEIGNVGAVRSFTASLAEQGTLVVANQLADAVAGVREGIAGLAGIGGATKAGTAQMEEAVAGLQSLARYLFQLAAEYPEVLADPGFQQAVAALGNMAEAVGLYFPAVTAGESGALDLGMLLEAGSTVGEDTPGETSGALLDPANLTFPDDISSLLPAFRSGLEELAAGLAELETSFAGRPDALMLPQTYLEKNEGLSQLKRIYLSEDGTAARLSVALSVGPYSSEAMQAVGDLRALAAAQPTPALVEGTSAIMLDLRDASSRDMTRAIISVLIGIFLVLVALLRSLVAPVYLILTILLSYAATLGIVRLVFSDMLGAAGITWWVPLFMFVMLVALGMDYNIFLMGRVKEEVGRLGTRQGIPAAVARTGAIITSAGIIMAGTFAAMISSSLLGLRQIGFAVAVGVLLDTFVIRTAVVPAIAVLLGRWSWWPRRRPKPVQEDEPPVESAAATKERGTGQKDR